MDRRVFWWSLLLVGVICVPVMIAPERGQQALDAVLGLLTGQFGWLYLWFAVAVFGFLVWLGCSRYGKVKFGTEQDKPEFSTLSWLAMIFTASIGGGIMYWGVIEWAYYYNDPPMQMNSGSVEAAHWAATYPMFHWGFTAWGLFCLPALALAYVYHVRKQRTLRLSDACRGVLGRHADGWIGRVIDVLFIFGLVGAAGTSLGLEVPMVSGGLAEITPLRPGMVLDVAVIVVWTLLFGVSVFLGLQKGLRRLADINIWLAFGLGAFILVMGPTVFMIDTFTNSVGILLQNFVEMSFYTDPVGGSGFEEDWTVFYWGWWISYAPFVGLFVARISKGRTIRGMIAGMCLAGSAGCWIAFALLGNTAMFYQIADIVPVADIVRSQGNVAGTMAALSQLPLGTTVLAVFVLLVVLFLATTLDSSAYTMAAVSSRELPRGADPARWHRVFWAVVLAAVSIALMYAGGLEALQTLSIITAFPLIFVLALVAESLRRWLRADHGGGGAADVAVASDSSSEAVPRSESPATTTEEPHEDRPVAATSE
ncbi:betaine/carnitine transporter, BCCT family [Actinopolyspora alba]|uniref:Betaine/carnitine transporter, BCCT family n=1 Tax=Actinopolyspora alba TaxID=673379 RepID=A0A1I2A538_9ACTN|nr:BCCT family transporter [Actinopolyspora alba]SFE39155.1 betaine/carnitine transporter, BCCT family [Actinopolyspora alba]